jgi:hypothetical protein
MANSQNSIFAYGLTRSGKIVIADHPKFDDHRVAAETRGSHREALREAITFAQMAVEEEVYINKARDMGTTAYNIAIVDWLGAPKVLEFVVDNWTGEIGQVIRVKAKDNVMVASVRVVIRDANENVLEEGAAVQSGKGSAWWSYTTRSRIKMTPFPIVEATAWDLPGNTDSFAIS